MQVLIKIYNFNVKACVINRRIYFNLFLVNLLQKQPSKYAKAVY